MSTTTRVIIKVKPEYHALLKFTINRYDYNKIPREWDEEIKFMCNDNYVSSYIHHDGYLDGVGWGLYKDLPNNYKDILLYILQGNRTSFDTPYYRCDETYESNKPKLYSEIPNTNEHNYYYLYTDEISGKWEWFYRTSKEWISLEEAFKDKVEDLKKYDKLEILYNQE